MTDLKTLIKIKKEMKRKMPEFIRADYHKKKKLHSAKWRRPRGITNKMRLQHRGHRVVVKKGYRTPKVIRGAQKDGKSIVIVSNTNDLKNIKKDEKISISSTVGTRKKIMIIEEATKLKIEVINFRDAVKYKENAISNFNKKKENQKTKKTVRDSKKTEAEKKKAKVDKKTVEEKVDDETKKSEDKKEKDKVLTQKD